MSDIHAAENVTDNAAHIEPLVNEAEAKARRLGWVGKDEFKGDPERWRPAEAFLERGETLLPLLKRDNERLHGRLTEVESLLKETREASKELLAFTSKSEERAYTRAKAEIQAKIEQAAATADPNAVRAGMQELDALNAEHVKPAPKPAAEKPVVAADPVIQDWISKEEWFTKSAVLNTFATETFGELERSKPGLSKAELLTETKRKTMEKFPEKFGINPARNGAAVVAEPGGALRQRKTGKTYDDLPAEAKKACDKFVRTIPGYTRDKYVKDYDWND